MVCPHLFETITDKRRVQRRGLHFGGRSAPVGADVLVVHGSDVEGGYKARKYQLIEPSSQSIMEPTSSALFGLASSESASFNLEADGRELAECSGADQRVSALCSKSEIGDITHEEAVSLQTIREALSGFETDRKLGILHHAHSQLLTENSASDPRRAAPSVDRAGTSGGAQEPRDKA